MGRFGQEVEVLSYKSSTDPMYSMVTLVKQYCVVCLKESGAFTLPHHSYKMVTVGTEE